MRGIGKTSVAIVAAERAIGSFEDGAWLIDSAPLRDESVVPHAIAVVTDLVVHSANAVAALSRFLRGRKTLFVFDKCEHMLAPVVLPGNQVTLNITSLP